MSDVVLALFEVAPAAYLAREVSGPHRAGPREIRGISLQIKPDALHGLVAAKYEVMLRESNLAPEPAPIEPEFKMGPVLTRRVHVSEEGHGRAGLSEKVHRLAARASDARDYQAVVEEYLHTNPWNRFKAGHKRIWELHCQGVDERGIVEEVKVPKTTVHRVLDLHRARLGIVR